MIKNNPVEFALLCGAITFIFLFIFVYLKGNTIGNRFVKKAKRKGCVTTGRVKKHVHRRLSRYETRHSSEIVTYEYFVNGKSYKKKITFTDIGIVIDYPEQVEIYYSKLRPSRSYADVETSYVQQKQTGCYITLFVPIAVIIIVVNLIKYLF